MGTFRYLLVVAVATAFAAWLAITVASAVTSAFARATVQLEQVNAYGDDDGN